VQYAPTRLAVWQREAEREEPQAQYLLALCHESGIGLTHDDAKRVHWLRKAIKAIMPRPRPSSLRSTLACPIPPNAECGKPL
jgi:hypothetical protein